MFDFALHEAPTKGAREYWGSLYFLTPIADVCTNPHCRYKSEPSSEFVYRTCQACNMITQIECCRCPTQNSIIFPVCSEACEILIAMTEGLKES